MTQVLVVEADEAQRRYTELVLREHGYNVLLSTTAAAAQRAVGVGNIDVVLIELALPDADGIALCRDLRSITDAALILLSSRTDEVAKVLGLDAGADDYLAKPYSVGELTARIRAILRRRLPLMQNDCGRLENAGIVLEPERHRVLASGEEVPVTPTEFQLLRLLMADSERVIPRDEILESVWGPGYYGDPNVLDAHISGLRRKLKRIAGQADPVLTVRGVGYRFCDTSVA